MSTIGLDQSPHAPGASGGSLRTLRWLKAAVVLALAVPALIFAIIAWIAWQAAFTDARERLERTAHVASEHAMRVFDTSNALLDRVFDLLGDDGPEALAAREKQIHDKLVAMSRPLPQLQSIWVIDAQGNALAGNRFYPRPVLNVADREYFKAHAAGHDREYVTETLWGKVTHQPFFDLSRRREAPDGRFAGLVSVGLHPQHFTDFYAKLPSSDITSVTLLRRDGAFIARWPVMPPLGTRLPPDGLLRQRLAAQEQQGILEGYSGTSQSDRVAAFRVVGDYPLVVVAATDDSAIVAGWRREVAVLAGLTFPTALALAWVAYVALRRTQREFAVSARLQQETAHRERVEDALRHSQKLEAMGRLTGGVAHDFNNLLAVVNNNVFLIRHQHPQVGQGAPLASIERAVGAGVKLTRQLLAFSRHQPLAPQSIMLQQALPALRDLLRSAVGGAVELKVEVDADTAPIVVDIAEFELAVLNLSVNAKDAMPSGGRLSIHASNEAAVAPPSVRIDVTDSGTGIAPEIRDRIFEPFFTTKPPGQGTGLGLAQVWALCRSAGGRVELDSEPGRGSRFTMHFPAARPEQAPDVTDHRDDVAAVAPLSCDLLLVEDNEAVARAMIDVLEALGCRVQHRSNGDQALTLLASRKELHTPVDIVLSDITMPGAIDGVALGDWIQRTDPTLAVVLMTGYSRRIDDALQQRFDVLAKPFTPQELRSALSRALNRSRARATADAAATLQHAAPAP